MIIIQQPAESCFKLLGSQKTELTSVLRPILFLIRQPIKEGVLLFNSLSKEMVLLSSEEDHAFVTDPHSLPELVSHWFAVPVDHDDRLLARQYRNVARLIAPPFKGITNFTIFTTTDCNARCFYCYELGRARIPMSLETADRVSRFIIEQANGNKVNIQWFGGEPLYNKPVITRICSSLSDAGLEYASTMISNAYLMDAETIQEAKELWHLQEIQITIDGTEDVYNKTKAYIYKTGNPYKTVIGNIQHLLAANIRVNIRLNASLRNIDNLTALIDDLHQAINSETKPFIYPTPIYGLGQTLNKDQLSILYDRINFLQNRLYDWGLFHYRALPRKVKGNGCMADNDRAVTILTDGHLGKCEHFSDSDWFGHIDNPIYDNNVIASYREEAFFKDVCDDCAIYPECHRLSKCNLENPCYQEMRDSIIQEYRYAMLAAYDKFLKGELTDKTDDDDPQA